MTNLAARLAAHDPDVLVLVHGLAATRAPIWGICARTPLSGHFGALDAGRVGVTLPGALAAAAQLEKTASEHGIATHPLAPEPIDHAALTPMYFLQRAGWEGATLLVSVPASPGGSADRMGAAITAAAERANERWAVVASGTLSRRLNPGSPSGYDTRAKAFDESFKRYLDAGDAQKACRLDPALRELAAEDAVDACRVASSAAAYASAGHRIYAYEAPFGVGYIEALLHEDAAPRGARRGLWDNRPWPAMLQIARSAIAARIDHNPYRAPPLPSVFNEPQGVCVMLRQQDGGVRGFMSHVEPKYSCLSDEIAECATVAATQDVRFTRITQRELLNLYIEISVLTKPEPVTDVATLDPKRYGVVVSSGRNRGVVLPETPEAPTVEAQLALAAARGQLPPRRPWTIERFEVAGWNTDTPEAFQAMRKRRA